MCGTIAAFQVSIWSVFAPSKGLMPRLQYMLGSIMKSELALVFDWPVSSHAAPMSIAPAI